MARESVLAAVPRFYFHLHDDFDVRDEEGLQLMDAAAARAAGRLQARRLIGELVKEQGRIALHHSIRIEDENGKLVEVITFRDIVRIEDEPIGA